MKILHIITANNFGGAEKLMLQLLPSLSKGCTVECLILSRKNSDESSDHAANDIAERLRNDQIHVFREHYSSLKDKITVSVIAAIINKGQYDLVHSHLKYPDVWLAWLKFRKKISVPVVTTIHGYNDDYQNKYGFSIKLSRLLRSPYYFLTRWTYRHLDGFILISKIVDCFFTRSGLVRSASKRVIYHGYRQVPQLAYRSLSAELRIAIPGRLLLLKGHRFGIQAIELLRSKGINASLHIFGDGPEKHNILNLIKETGLADRIFLHGYVDNMLGRLHEMDIVLVPSLWEGFGLVILDAFAAGRPLITFDLPACNEIVQHEKNGLLATPYSAQSIVDCVEKLMADDDFCQQLVQAGYKSLRQDFTIERMASDYRDFYKQILSNRS